MNFAVEDFAKFLDGVELEAAACGVHQLIGDSV